MITQKKWSLLQTGKLWVLAGVLAALALLMSCNDDDDGSTGPERPEANIRIVMVDASQDQVTLKNFGDSEADISEYFFCRQRDYTPFSSTPNDADDLVLAQDEEVTFTISVADEASDVAIYNTGGAFADANALADFMQFGASFTNNGREAVAVEKGIWTAGEFIAGGSPFSYIGDGAEDGAGFWVDDTNIRMVRINPATDEVTIKNFDTQTKDISGYFFCTTLGVYPSFTATTDVEIISGDLTLDPDEEVTLKVLTTGGVVDDNGAIFLFSSDVLGFNNANGVVLRDFAQWDAGNGFRAENAVNAGRWDDVANFIDGNEPFVYEGGGDDTGAGFWQGTN